MFSDISAVMGLLIRQEVERGNNFGSIIPFEHVRLQIPKQRLLRLLCAGDIDGDAI
jgi:hypothetical protein